MNTNLAGHEPAPAKINLWLHIKARRADGYHELETLFAFTAFGDQLWATPAADWSLAVEGPMAAAISNDPQNLVLRAAHAFQQAAGSRRRYALRLDKHIPVAAGLGGGSADAAATLRLLNRLAGQPLRLAELERIGASLGADVPACVRLQPAIGTGTGTTLQDAPPIGLGADMGVLLVNPRVPVSTAKIFAAWASTDSPAANSADWRQAQNDLEPAAIGLLPEIADVLAWLRGLQGVQLARMSGSGATCFALFDGPVPNIKVPKSWWSASTQLLP